MSRNVNSTGMKYWQISPGREEAGFWPEFKRKEIIAIGWDDLGDLRRYDSGTEKITKENIEKALKKYYPEYYPKDSYTVNSVNSIYVFFKEMKQGA